MLWTLAMGTRVEDAEWRGVPPARLHTSPPPPAAPLPRTVSVFRRGLSWLGRQVARGRLWQRLWLTPEPWPATPPGLVLTVGPPAAQPP